MINFYQTLTGHENTPDISCPHRKVCHSNTSEQTLARSVSDLHTLPPQTPASCDNTKTRPPEGRFVRLLFCIYVLFLSPSLGFKVCVAVCENVCVRVGSVLNKLLHIWGNIAYVVQSGELSCKSWISQTSVPVYIQVVELIAE